MKQIFIFLFFLVSFVGLKAQDSSLLKGTVITNGNVTEAKKAFDNSNTTLYRSSNSNIATNTNTPRKSWIGLDLGKAHVITSIEYYPGSGNMKTAIFEGANDPSFVDAVPLDLIKISTSSGVKYQTDVKVTRGFRYVRFVGANAQYTSAYEIKFYGYEGTGSDDKLFTVTNLPTVVVNTNDWNDPVAVKDNVVDGAYVHTYKGGNVTFIDETGKLSHSNNLEIRTRGNASASAVKVGFRMKLDKKANVLDAPAKAKNWTLIAAYADRSLIRSLLAYDISRQMDIYYTPYCKAVDLIVNGEYRGTYMLCDQLEVNKNKVNINEMTPDETDGDYFIEIDKYAERELKAYPETPECFITSNSPYKIPVTIKYPKDDEIVAAQHDFIKEAFSKMVNTVAGANYLDETTGYKNYLDIESFAKYFLMEELSGNNDAFQSVYMIKRKGDDKFYTGPVWDFDWSFQNYKWNLFKTVLNDQPDYWNICDAKTQSITDMKSFLKRLMSDPVIVKEIYKVWDKVRTEEKITQEYLNKKADELVNLISESRQLNMVRWPLESSESSFSYTGEISHVKDYMTKRVAFIDNQVYGGANRFPGVYRLKLVNSDNQTLTMSGSNVTVSPYTDSSQDWYIQATGSGSSYTIRPLGNSSLAISVSSSNQLSVVTANASSASQKWSVLQMSDGSYKLVSQYNGLALTWAGNNLTFVSTDEGSQNWDIKISKLYLAGNATSAGWNLSNMLSLPLKDGEAGVFTWTGVLNAGDFKFQLTRNSSWLPSVNSTSNGQVVSDQHKLVVNTTYDNDYKFTVPSTNYYTLVADMNNLTLNVMKHNLESNTLVDGKYMIRVTGTNDAFIYSSAYTAVSLNDYLNDNRDWSIIPVGGGYYAIKAISSATKAIAVTSTGINMVTYSGADSQLWSILKQADGSFIIMSKSNALFLTATDSKIGLGDFSSAQSFDINFSKLYLTGDATSAAWDINKIISMPLLDDEPGVFTWTGALKKGDFRFQLTRNASWVPIVHSLTQHELVKDENELVISTTSKSGYRFTINEATNYTIVADMNQLKMYVSQPLSLRSFNLENNQGQLVIIGLKGSIEVSTNGLNVDKVRLVDIKGSLVESAKNKAGTFYLGNSLVPGVYIVEFMYDGKIEQQKVRVK